MSGAILSIIGTLAGTALGWALNSISQKGKLNFFISKWEESFQKQDEYGGLVPSESIVETDTYSWELIVDVHNSDINSKIMRSIMVVFCDQNENVILSFTPYDTNTRHVSAHRICYDELKNMNIPGKTVVSLQMNNGLGEHNESFRAIWNDYKVYLTYIDEKNKLKKVFIREIKAENRFNSN